MTRHDVTLCLMWITIHQKSVDKCRQSPIDNRSIIDWLSINNELIRSSAVVRQRGVNGSRRPSMGPLHPPACSLVPPPRLGGSGLILHTCAARMAPRANRPARPPLSTGLALFPLFVFCRLFGRQDRSCPNNIAILNCKHCHLKQRRKLHTQQCLACKCLLLAPRHCAWRGDLWDYERAFTHAENYRHGRGGW